ncbi:MAG: hypothetical protein JXQ73_08325 [Phycisphaerae bacterium]|nr:hypothetical protein [Phycisphaerae bacterium]
METWLPIWKWTLIIGVAFFTVLSIVVFIGGVYDIRAMFRSLAEQHEKRQAEPDRPTDD